MGFNRKPGASTSHTSPNFLTNSKRPDVLWTNREEVDVRENTSGSIPLLTCEWTSHAGFSERTWRNDALVLSMDLMLSQLHVMIFAMLKNVFKIKLHMFRGHLDREDSGGLWEHTVLLYVSVFKPLLYHLLLLFKIFTI